MQFIHIINGTWVLRSTEETDDLNVLTTRVMMEIHSIALESFPGYVIFFELDGAMLPQISQFKSDYFRILMKEGPEQSKDIAQSIINVLMRSGDIKGSYKLEVSNLWEEHKETANAGTDVNATTDKDFNAILFEEYEKAVEAGTCVNFIARGVQSMKKKTHYPLDNKSRGKFKQDLYTCAFKRQVPIAVILREFFQDNELSDLEKGSYANYAAFHDDNLPEACTLLVHALNITPQEASQRNIFKEFFSCSDIIFHSAAISIDNMLNWPTGTVWAETKLNLDMWVNGK